jgi:hypothetical protein
MRNAAGAFSAGTWKVRPQLGDWRCYVFFAIGLVVVWTVSLLAALIFLIRKFLGANPEMKDAAKKAATDRATQLINRVLK